MGPNTDKIFEDHLSNRTIISKDSHHYYLPASFSLFHLIRKTLACKLPQNENPIFEVKFLQEKIKVERWEMAHSIHLEKFFHIR